MEYLVAGLYGLCWVVIFGVAIDGPGSFFRAIISLFKTDKK